jgi:hypothetical protein
MDTSSHNIARLASLHLRRYRARLARAKAGSKEYKASDLNKLVSCWESVLRKGCKWDSLAEDERLELATALQDEAPEEE